MASSGPPAVAPMSKWNKDALISLERDLKINLSLEDLTDLLERPAGGFMTEAEKMSVCEETKQREKAGRIISLLRRKGDGDFDIFIKLLRESGNEVWAEQLEEKAGRLRREALGETVASAQTQETPPPATVPSPQRPPTLDSTPTLRTLDDKVVAIVAAKWDTLAIHLGVDMSLVAIVRKNNPIDCEGACRDLLNRWLKGDRNSGSDARTWRTVLQAVGGCGFREHASKLEREMEDGSVTPSDKS